MISIINIRTVQIGLHLPHDHHDDDDDDDNKLIQSFSLIQKHEKVPNANF